MSPYPKGASIPRRDFLATTGSAMAAGLILRDVSAEDERQQASTIPPHRPLYLEGIHAYIDRVSVHAGEAVRVYASSTLPYELELVRLGQNVDGPEGDEVLAACSVPDPTVQPIHPGSYVHAPPLANEPLSALTVECWVRLWDLTGEQCIISQFDHSRSAGFALSVNRQGEVFWYAGDGGPFQERWRHASPAGTLLRTQTAEPSVPTPERVAFGGRGIQLAPWHHLVVVCDGRLSRLFVDGRPVAEWPTPIAVRPGTAPLRLGAWGRDGQADGFLDADLAMPALYARALSAAEIAARYKDKALKRPPSDALLACWPLDEERGDLVADIGPNQHHGRIINLGTWMIGGPAFKANLDRFAPYNPAADPERGHGLRLASDDLYDCRWQPTHEFHLPASARSGIYAARFHVQVEGRPRLYHALFIVKPAGEAPPAPIAFIAATNTWRAYCGTPFCETWDGIGQAVGHAYVNSPGKPPEFSFYWQHYAGQGGYQMGLRLPWPVAGPYTYHAHQDWRCSHLCHADRLTLTWLQRAGYRVDVYADLDLHQHPDLLARYRAICIAGHSEYWSRQAYDGLMHYLEHGGQVLCFSGNTIFWRVSFDDDCTVMECRKVDAPGAQMPPDLRGEAWHSHDGARGGMARECGMPAWSLLGLEFMSVFDVTSEGIGPYRVAADHPLFHQPHETGLGPGDPFGASPSGRPELIGHEGDVRISTLARVCLQPLPEGAFHPTEDPPGIVLLAEGVADWNRVQGAPWDYFQRPVVAPPERTAIDVAAEMIYWERPDGGRVFHAGSVSAGHGFANDPRFALLVRNVLHRFGIPSES